MHNVRVHMRRGLLCGALALSLGGLALGGAATFVAPAPAYAASAKKDGSLKGIEVQKKVDRYTWSELSRISDAIGKSGSKKAAIKIASKYNLCSGSGNLDGSQQKTVVISGKTIPVRIVGLYHDQLSDSSQKAGITWQFVEPLVADDLSHMANSGGYVTNALEDDEVLSAILNALPADLSDRIAAVDKKTVSDDSNARAGKATGQSLRLWNPSGSEVLGNANKIPGLNRDSKWMAKALNAEGTQYQFYKDEGFSWTDANNASPLLWNDPLLEQEFDHVDDGQGALVKKFSGVAPASNRKEDGACSMRYRSNRYMPEDVNESSFGIAVCGPQGEFANWNWKGEVAASCPMFCLTATADDASVSSSAKKGVAPVLDTVDAYSWKELKNIANQIAKASDDDTALAIAEKYHLCAADGTMGEAYGKKVKLSDGTETTAVIIGFRHDDRADGEGKAGITFMCSKYISKQPMNADGTSTGGWKESDLRRALNGKIFKKLPSDLRKNITKVSKSTFSLGAVSSADDLSLDNVTKPKDLLWVPAYSEVVGSTQIEQDVTEIFRPTMEAEGLQYQYFMNADGSFNEESFTSLVDGGSGVWLRTCDSGASGAGLFNNYKLDDSEAEKDACVCPAFCL